MKILHTADWHIDSPFAGRTPEQREVLRRAQRKIPQLVVDACHRENCDMILLAGDIFDGEYTKEGYEAVYTALASCSVPVFVSPGNHDFIAPGSVWLEEVWSENVHIFKGGMESVALPELNCRVYGAAFRSMDSPDLLADFRTQCTERFSVAVLHGDPTNAASPYNPVTTAEIRTSGLDYLALGHIHKRGMFHAGGTVCAWPGCPMGRGFDETGECGVYITTLDAAHETKFLPLNTLRFHELAVDTTLGVIEALETVLPGFGNHDFYRITLTGCGEGELSRIYDHFQHIPNLELRDLRREKIDIWACAGEDSLQGAYFGLLKNAYEEATDEERESIRLAAEISRDLLDGREVELP